jgi:hypothetical protein
MITEMQVVVTSGIVVLVAVVTWCAAAWWCAGRYEEIITDREEEIDGLKDMLGWDQRLGQAAAPEVAHDDPVTEIISARAEFDVHAGQAMAVANSPDPGRVVAWAPLCADLSVTAWTQAMAADMDRYIESMTAARPGGG